MPGPGWLVVHAPIKSFFKSHLGQANRVAGSPLVIIEGNAGVNAEGSFSTSDSQRAGSFKWLNNFVDQFIGRREIRYTYSITFRDAELCARRFEEGASIREEEIVYDPTMYAV